MKQNFWNRGGLLKSSRMTIKKRLGKDTMNHMMALGIAKIEAERVVENMCISFNCQKRRGKKKKENIMNFVDDDEGEEEKRKNKKQKKNEKSNNIQAL